MENEKENLHPAQESPEPPEPSGPQNAIQRFYEHFRGIPLKYIDAFIAVCLGALALLLIVGALKGRGAL